MIFAQKSSFCGRLTRDGSAEKFCPKTRGIKNLINGAEDEEITLEVIDAKN